MKFVIAFLSLALLTLVTADFLPEKCSVTFCGTRGAHTDCLQASPDKVITCATWATTKEALVQCKFQCTDSCYLIPLLASDGNRYCTPCDIHQVSCKTGFKVFGPVEGSFPTSRQEGAIVSRDIVPHPVCSMSFCTKRGAFARCLFPLSHSGSVVISCLRFSFTSQSGAQCRFFCPLFCLPEDQQPVASTGEKFCSECILRQESCRTHYKTFGPVAHTPLPAPTVSPKPTVPTCSVPVCTSSGRAAPCLLNGTRPATCADYAKTDDKKKNCDFACIQICVDQDEAPVDNFGKKYCSGCHLRIASCQSDFKIFFGRV